MSKRLYKEVMMELDWSVGEILKELKDNELESKTVVICTNDNGPPLNYGNYAKSNGRLREAG